jgi:prepilin-type N-terminal cleavage/methylation domain-containing protein
MQRSQGARGFTLVEVLVAVFVLLIGATGVMTLYSQGRRLHGDARHMTRATAIAQDLLAAIEFWDFDNQATAGGPLYNSQPLNDANIGDVGYHFESSADPLTDGLADHGEADLPAGFTGLPAAALLPLAGGGTEYQRFWNVAVPPNATGGHDAMMIAVVVRWRAGLGGTSWHRLTLLSVKPNPATVH